MKRLYSKTSTNHLTILRMVIIFISLGLLTPAVWAKNVPQTDAQQIAVTFYRLNNPSGILNPQIKSATVKSWENVPLFYIFRFVTGGFILVAADDASIPILAYSFENDMPEVIDNPAAAGILDNYAREIAFIKTNNFDNSETLKEWRSIEQGQPSDQTDDVAPLLTTTWDQGCFYNTLCPADEAGECGHTYTGCVGIAISQILKYHNFPPQGAGQHSYIDGNYGQQSADFGNTTYDWQNMPNALTSDNTAVETLIYHAGVSTDMGYGTSGSGAQSETVHDAFLNYFNYSPELQIIYRDNYANPEDFKALLMADLDAGLPVYYAGWAPQGGHDFICDGYRLSDGKFHFNIGWGGSANGYYTIGSLNLGGYSPNTGNIVVVHIKPGNPNLIVRITNPADKVVADAGSNVEIVANTVRGSATLMKVFIDDVEKYAIAEDSISFTWNTSVDDLGSHSVKAFAINETDTVYYQILVNLTNSSQWISQSSGFSVPRAITYLSACDSNTVWASASDANNPWWATCSDFARTTDGGNTWTHGVITNTEGLMPSMIFGIDQQKAYAAMYKLSGNTPIGIFMTADGGTTWNRQESASFGNAASWPQVVHFFNANDGFCMGNPVNGEFEIYTTSDCGTTWILVPGANIPNKLSYEIGVPGCYSAVNDTIWFGTNKGRVYKSVDKGLNWTVNAVTVMNGKFVKPVFRDGSHGLLLDELSGAGTLCETFDGGDTWTQINYTGPKYCGDLAYIPGTTNTWVRSGFITGALGCAFSFDGGHTWTDFPGTTGSQFCQMAWVNDHCGWSGGINSGSAENGIHKFIGTMLTLPAPQNVEAVVNITNAEISWDAPAFDPLQMTLLGYNISRNGTKINSSLITGLNFSDQNVPNGQYSYCVTAQYNTGASEGSCVPVDITLGIFYQTEQPLLMVYPNPADDKIMVKTTSQSSTVTIFDHSGKLIPVTVKNLQFGIIMIDISGLSPGFYLVSVKSEEGISRSKLIVN